MLPRVDAETEPGCDGMSEVRKTRKGEWWQPTAVCPEVTCAAVMPPTECVGRHAPSECCERVSRDGHALDKRGSPRTKASPRQVRACMFASDMSRLRFSGTGAMLSAGGNSGIPGCHQYGASRVTSGGKGPCMMAAFTASRHFMATLGAPRPRWEHAWRPPLAGAGVLWLCRPIRCSRIARKPST